MKATQIKNLFFSTAVAGMLAVGLTALPASARTPSNSHIQASVPQQSGWSNQVAHNNSTANTNNGWVKQGANNNSIYNNSAYNNGGWTTPAPVQAASCSSAPTYGYQNNGYQNTGYSQGHNRNDVHSSPNIFQVVLQAVLGGNSHQSQDRNRHGDR